MTATFSTSHRNKFKQQEQRYTQKMTTSSCFRILVERIFPWFFYFKLYFFLASGKKDRLEKEMKCIRFKTEIMYLVVSCSIYHLSFAIFSPLLFISSVSIWAKTLLHFISCFFFFGCIHFGMNFKCNFLILFMMKSLALCAMLEMNIVTVLRV